MHLASVLALTSFACLVAGGVIVVRICWAEGVTLPWGQYRLIYDGLTGRVTPRQSARIKLAVFLWVLALTLMVVAFIVAPAT